MIRAVLGVFFRSVLGTSTPSVNLMNGNVVAELKVLNRVSGHERRTEKVEKVGPKEENGAYIRKVTEEANLLPDVEEKLGKSVLFMWVMPAPSCEACICNVLLTRLTLSVATAISHGISVLKHTRLNELMHWETVTQNLSNGLINTVARFEVPRYNKGQPLFDRVCME
jgi:hypothetical protein